MQDEEPCGFCAYRQSCGYGGPDRCDETYTSAPSRLSRDSQCSLAICSGNRASIIPLHVSEQVCHTNRGLDRAQVFTVHLTDRTTDEVLLGGQRVRGPAFGAGAEQPSGPVSDLARGGGEPPPPRPPPGPHAPALLHQVGPLRPRSIVSSSTPTPIASTLTSNPFSVPARRPSPSGAALSTASRYSTSFKFLAAAAGGQGGNVEVPFGLSLLLLPVRAAPRAAARGE